jgi:hypothetical protein
MDWTLSSQDTHMADKFDYLCLVAHAHLQQIATCQLGARVV